MKILILILVLMLLMGIISFGQKVKPDRLQPTPVIPPEPKKPFFGCSVYELIQQTNLDIHNFLFDLKRAGGNATEIFLVHSLNKNTFQPYIYDGKMFDLETWNETFWDKFRFFLRTCKELGIVPFIRVHDFCSIKRPECNKFYCFMSNIQGFTNVYDEGLCPYYSKLNQRILKELKDAGIEKFFLIPMNECDGDVENVYEFNGAYMGNWIQRGVPKDQIILSADPKHFDRLKRSGCRLEVHDVASIGDLQYAIKDFGEFIFPNGDGTRNGEGLSFDWTEYAEPSIEQARELGNHIRTINGFGYCFKMRSIFVEKGVINMSKADFDVLRALVGK